MQRGEAIAAHCCKNAISAYRPKCRTCMTLNAEEDEQYTTTDAESILDVCSSHFRRARSLRWHYRSQHHSLIDFSNHNFYRGDLIVFPSPYGQSSRFGVRATYLADAIYENQTNVKEAKRVVDAAVEHVLNRAFESLGIVTLNIKQRDLIAELLEDRLQKFKEAEALPGEVPLPGTVMYLPLWKFFSTFASGAPPPAGMSAGSSTSRQ